MVREPEPSTSVELPATLVQHAKRLADQQQWNLSEAVTYLISRGIDAQQETERAVTDAYNRYMNTSGDQRDKAGQALIQSIFGHSSGA